MKSTTKDLFGRVLMLVAIVGLTTIAAFSQNDRGGGRLAGTWDASISRTDCATGNPLVTFKSIANFNQGGTFLGSTAGTPQAARTPEHGVWRHVSGNTYEFKFKSFNFDATGTATGYVIVRHDLELDETADEYTSSGEAKFYNMAGVQVGQGCSSGVGTRFTF